MGHWNGSGRKSLNSLVRTWTSALIAGVAVFPLSASMVSAGGPCGNDFCEGIFCFFNGIRNTPTGTAKLGLDDGCVLRVTEIGSSGADGFFQQNASFPRTGFVLDTRSPET